MMNANVLVQTYGDLLGARVVPGQCGGLVREVLRRLGRKLPPYALPTAEEFDVSCAAPECWAPLAAGARREVGDVVYSKTPCGAHHLSVIVDARDKIVVLTTSADRGVCIVELRTIPFIVNTYRLKPEE